MKTKIFFNFLFLGLTLGVSQSFITLLPFTIFVYYFILSRIYKINSHLIGLLYGWIFGTGFFLGSMHWMVNPFLVYEKHFYLIPLGAFVFPVLMGLFFSIPFGLIVFTKKYVQFLKDKIFLKSLIVSLFFLFAEILRSKLFGGLPLNLTGHIWAFESEFIQITKFFGIFGLTFLTILWFVLIANFLIEKKIKTLFFTVFFFPLVLWSFNLSNSDIKDIENDGLFIRVVQPNILQKEKWNRIFFEKNFEKLINLSLKDNNTDIPKIVIWPEAALTLYLNEEIDFLNYLKEKLPTNIILVTGALRRVFEDDKVKIFNSLYVLKDNNLLHYDKKKLVPFGEFIPFRFLINFLKLTPGSTDFSVGKTDSQIEITILDKKIIFEPSICYEAIFQTSHKKESQFLINITNDGWFGKTVGPKQHLSAQIFRAVEKSNPLIRSANSGISVVTDENGKIIKKINLGQDGYFELKIPLKKNETFFEIYGNYSMVILIFFIFFLFYLIDSYYQLKVIVKYKLKL